MTRPVSLLERDDYGCKISGKDAWADAEGQESTGDDCADLLQEVTEGIVDRPDQLASLQAIPEP